MLSFVPSASATLARACIKAIGTATPSFSWQEDLIGEEGELVNVSKQQILVPMEILVCSLVIFNVKGDANTSEELPKDVLSIGVEFFLSMWVGP